jgi:hypothetical protein
MISEAKSNEEKLLAANSIEAAKAAIKQVRVRVRLGLELGLELGLVRVSQEQ